MKKPTDKQQIHALKVALRIHEKDAAGHAQELAMKGHLLMISERECSTLRDVLKRQTEIHQIELRQAHDRQTRTLEMVTQKGEEVRGLLDAVASLKALLLEHLDFMNDSENASMLRTASIIGALGACRVLLRYQHEPVLPLREALTAKIVAETSEVPRG